MKFLALLLLLNAAAPERLLLMEDTFQIASGEVRAIDLGLEQEHAVIEVDYEVSGGSGITVALLGPGVRNTVAEGRSRTYLRLLPDQSQGRFRFPAAASGIYQIALDGRGLAGDAEVKLKVALVFDASGLMRPDLVSSGRRGAVVAVSLLMFFAVAFWSGRKIVRSFNRRTPSSPPPLF